MRRSLKIKKVVALALACVMVLAILTPANSFASTRENDYPLVLVHGFAGFGRDELLGYKYWGGFTDIEQVLNDSNHTTYTATVGKFSSNWDRACELYAYIKGGTVDYGEAHSQKYGHERFGKTYLGLYNSWGESPSGKIKKVHLIGHSMGGQTIYALVQLLENGSSEERAATKEGLNPLFEGGKSWVQSITTISSTNDGTSFADVGDMKDLAKNLLAASAALSGTAENELLYDFGLEQWGLKRNSGESFSSYNTRVFNSNVWEPTNTDFSIYDMKTKGASELNGWVKAQPDVYYFSWATKTTHTDRISGKSYPNVGCTNPIFLPTALIMGSYTRNEPGLPIIDQTWFPNDGAVNCISQKGPKLNSEDIIVKYNGTPQIGKWNYMGMLDHTDHMRITGADHIMTQELIDWYKELADNVASLPVTN